METPKDLKEKIRGLETERANLVNEVEKLRKAAEQHAVALQEEINRMREEAKILNEILAPEEEAVVTTTVAQSDFTGQKNLAAGTQQIVEPKGELAAETEVSAKAEVEAGDDSVETEDESVLRTLSANERNVVEILVAHDGKYPQRLIRVDAGLSWLETRRIVSRLSDRGIAALENSGAENNVVLKKQLK